jgi:hypothetical protein
MNAIFLIVSKSIIRKNEVLLANQQPANSKTQNFFKQNLPRSKAQIASEKVSTKKYRSTLTVTVLLARKLDGVIAYKQNANLKTQ